MALRQIRLDGDPILRKKSREVEAIDDKLLEFIDDMIDTMRHSNGIGLAAPQVGVLKRVIVIDVGEKPIKAINPIILETEGSISDIEGCLSVPQMRGTVERPEKIKVTFKNEEGIQLMLEPTGYLARVFCHEIDHLDGILYTDMATDMYQETPEDEDQ